MNETIRQQLTALARSSALEAPADLEGAVRTGMRTYRQRLLWTQAAAVLAVALITGGAVWAWSAPQAQSSVAEAPAGFKVTPSATVNATNTAAEPTKVVALPTKTVALPTKTTAVPSKTTAVPSKTTAMRSKTTAVPGKTAAVPTDIAIGPSPMTLSLGSRMPATATGRYDDGTTKQLSSTVTWSTSDPKVAVVDSHGFVRGASPGTTTLSATLGGVTTAVPVTVSRPEVVLTRLIVEPNDVTLSAGDTRQLTATGFYSDGTTKQLSSTVTWSTSNAKVADVGTDGLVTARRSSSQTTTAVITATQDSFSRTVTVTVSAPIG